MSNNPELYRSANQQTQRLRERRYAESINPNREIEIVTIDDSDWATEYVQPADQPAPIFDNTDWAAILGQTEIQQIRQAELNSMENDGSNDMLESIHKYVNHPDESAINQLLLDAANFFQEGYEKEELDMSTLSEIRQEKLKTINCIFCQNLPMNLQNCERLRCPTFFCASCFERGKAYKSNCLRATSQPHVAAQVPPEYYDPMTADLKVNCRYGCQESRSNPKYMEYIDGDIHNRTTECPKRRCKHCGLLRTGPEKHVRSDNEGQTGDVITCKQAVRDTIEYVWAAMNYDKAVMRQKIDELERQLRQKDIEIRCKNTEIDQLKREVRRPPVVDQNMKKDFQQILERKESRIYELERRLRRFSDNICEPLGNKLNLAVNPIDDEKPVLRGNTGTPLVFFNQSQYGRREATMTLTKDNKWDELLTNALEVYKIPEREWMDYRLVDLKCRILAGQHKVGRHLKRTNVLNLVKKDAIQARTAYELDIRRIQPYHIPQSSHQRRQNADNDGRCFHQSRASNLSTYDRPGTSGTAGTLNRRRDESTSATNIVNISPNPTGVPAYRGFSIHRSAETEPHAIAQPSRPENRAWRDRPGEQPYWPRDNSNRHNQRSYWRSSRQ